MILLTGFEPFGNDTENPSRLSAALAAKKLESQGIPASFLEVPVVFATAGKTVLKRVQELNASPSEPNVDIVICVGVANGRDAVTPETVAYNFQHGRLPDNAGDKPDRKVIDEDVERRVTRLPVKAAIRDIERAGIPVEISHDAGRYVCNSLMYEVLAWFDGVAGFVHVPGEDVVGIEEQAEALVFVAKAALRVVRGESEAESVSVENGEKRDAPIVP